jgi:hypothetical protein
MYDSDTYYVGFKFNVDFENIRVILTPNLFETKASIGLGIN